MDKESNVGLSQTSESKPKDSTVNPFQTPESTDMDSYVDFYQQYSTIFNSNDDFSYKNSSLYTISILL